MSHIELSNVFKANGVIRTIILNRLNGCNSLLWIWAFEVCDEYHRNNIHFPSQPSNEKEMTNSAWQEFCSSRLSLFLIHINYNCRFM